MCPCCKTITSRFNTECETCFAALLEGRNCQHGAPDCIEKDTHAGTHTVTAGTRFRVTVWAARELANMAAKGVIFESFGSVSGAEQFGRSRYIADESGALHVYDSSGAKVLVHPAARKIRILSRR